MRRRSECFLGGIVTQGWFFGLVFYEWELPALHNTLLRYNTLHNKWVLGMYDLSPHLSPCDCEPCGGGASYACHRNVNGTHVSVLPDLV